MPVGKKTDSLIGPNIKTDDVFRIAELARLAEDWGAHGSEFPPALLSRYLELTNYYDVDGVLLLHATQTQLANRVAIDATGIMPAIGDGLSEVG